MKGADLDKILTDTSNESVPPLSLTEDVADRLRDMVIKGHLKPGEHVVERKLCAELSVSRTPMREALKLLRQDGLVEIFRNRGARVTPYSAESAVDLFEVISGLEGIAAARAAVRVTQDEIRTLEDLHSQMKREHRDRNLDAYFPLNSAIHDKIIAIADNPVLTKSHNRLMLLAQRGRYMAIMNTERWDQAIAEHDELMVALAAYDPKTAGEIWGRHLMNTGTSVAAALSDQEPIPET